MKYLFSYIHLNPIKLAPGEREWKETGLKNKDAAEIFIKKYTYSSLSDYLGDERIYTSIINKKSFLDV